MKDTEKLTIPTFSFPLIPLTTLNKLNSLVIQKNYQAAFSLIFGLNLKVDTSSWEFKYHSQFFTACDTLYRNYLYDVLRANNFLRRSSRVKSFIDKYSQFNSHYSMGELVSIRVDFGYFDHIFILKDSTRLYSGRNARKYNRNIVYGSAFLNIDFTSGKPILKLSVKQK